MVINEVIEEEDEEKNNYKLINNKNVEDCISNFEHKENNDDLILVNNIKVFHLNENKNDIYENNKNDNVINTHNNLIFNKIKSTNNNCITSKGKWILPSTSISNSKEKVFLTHKNTFNKYTSLRDKVLSINSSNNNTNNKLTLPELVSTKPNINENNNKKKLKAIKLNHTNTINETSSTRAMTNSTKKNLNTKQNLTEDVSKYRMGLLSAGSTNNGNNNIIIPMIPLKRPESNFNFGGELLWENKDINVNKRNQSKEKICDTFENQKNNNIIPINYNIKNYINSLSKVPTRNKTFKSQNIKKKIYFSEERYGLCDEIKIIPKLHKIKIEKGMMGSKFASFLNKQMIDYQKYLNNTPFNSLMDSNIFRSHSTKNN